MNPALYNANLSSNGVSFTKNEDGSVSIDGTATGTTNGYYLGEYIDVLSDGAEYVPSGGNNLVGLTVRIGYSNGDPDSYTINAFAVDKSTMSSIKPYFQVQSGVTVNDIFYPMLNAGSTALPWEPYTSGKPSPSPEYPQELVSAGDDGQIDVTVCGAQLIPLIEESYTNHGLTATLQNDGSLLINGTPDQAYSVVVRFTLSLEPGIYFISGGEMEKVYAQISTNKDGSTSFYINRSFTIDGTESLIQLQIQSGTSLDPITDYKIDAMLNKGDSALPIEPYTGKTITLTGDLPGIPVDSRGNYTDPDGQQWVCDTIDVVAKQKTQRIGIIDGYNGESVGDVWMSTTGQLTTGAKVLYQLDEPVTTQINADTPITYDGTTNVMATDGAGLSLRYIADTQKYIDNKIAALSAAMLEG